MENEKEVNRFWWKDAKSALESAEKAISIKEWRMAIQFAQVAMEEMVKAVIGCFQKPRWTHSPGEQLREIIEENSEEIEKIVGKDIKKLEEISFVVDKYAPWHGKSIYGDFEKRIPAVDLCTEEVAKEIVGKVKDFSPYLQNFIKMWFI